MVGLSCILVSKKYETDDDGNYVLENGKPKQTRTELEIPIIAEERVWKDEFYKANEQGLRPSIRLKISSLNYNDEEELIYLGKEYTIIRVDGKELDEIALVCQRRMNNV